MIRGSARPWGVRRKRPCGARSALRWGWSIHSSARRSALESSGQSIEPCIRRVNLPVNSVRYLLEKTPKAFEWTGPLRPGKVSSMRYVPDEIVKPDWFHLGVPQDEMRSPYQKVIPVHSKEAIQIMRESCKIGRRALDLAHRSVAVGVTTDQIDAIVHDFIIKNGAYPSPLNYHGFPKSLCSYNQPNSLSYLLGRSTR